MESTSKHKKAQASAIRDFYGRPGALILTCAVVLLGVFIAWQMLLPHGERVNQDGYQMVYTTNGNTYFGKLRSASGEYLVLDHPYTVQAVTPTSDKQDKSQTALLKLSQQTYGPEDVLSIRSDQVLFWQNLRSDSKVAKAIESKQ